MIDIIAIMMKYLPKDVEVKFIEQVDENEELVDNRIETQSQLDREIVSDREEDSDDVAQSVTMRKR